MSEQRERLAGEAAVRLWEEGRKAWNAWVAAHSEAEISFSGMDFSSYGTVSFEEFCFPNGNVNFGGAKFGEGDVNFGGADFGDGNVNFKYAKIGNRFLFSDCTLQMGKYDFSYMKFGGHALFDGLKNGRCCINRI